MVSKSADYLKSFEKSLKIDSAIKKETTREISTHLEDACQELKESGVNEEEALKTAIDDFGSPQVVAQQICEVHSQGSWQEAFFTAMPHLLIAALFASYYWQNIICLSLVLAATICMVIHGWRHSQPIWLFPWLGYYLLPVIVTGILLIYLPQGWTWLAAFIYIPLALFILIYIMKQTANRDWLYILLMLAPIPVVLSWLAPLGAGGQLSAVGMQFQANTLWLAISFLTLAMATVAFIRIKQRWYKAATLLISPSIILFSVTLANRGNIELAAAPILILSLCVLVIPVWMQLKLQTY
jgi:hypothetical protein